MDWSITHIVPFDLGQSFMDYDSSSLKDKEIFLKKLKEFTKEKNYNEFDSTISKCFFCVKLNELISCYLLDYGVGVFVIENIKDVDLNVVREQFEKDIPCVIYYSKQKEQRLILDHQITYSDKIKNFMHQIWSMIQKVERPYSSSKTYKFQGFSYVFSIYHILKSQDESAEDEEKGIDLLMNPSILNKLYDNTQWGDIKNKLLHYFSHGYNSKELTSTSVVASSWSAIAIIEEKETDSIKKILNYEIELQASWFLFDCLIDNIKKNNMSNLELQKEKSLATNISLEISVILGANMSLSDKNVFESIYSTTGFELLRKKLFLLLENRISIEEAKINERQSKYGIITEILLVLFTLVSIYDPLRNLINGEIKPIDMALGIFMTILFLICSYLIIRKGK